MLVIPGFPWSIFMKLNNSFMNNKMKQSFKEWVKQVIDNLIPIIETYFGDGKLNPADVCITHYTCAIPSQLCYTLLYDYVDISDRPEWINEWAGLKELAIPLKVIHSANFYALGCKFIKDMKDDGNLFYHKRGDVMVEVRKDVFPDSQEDYDKLRELLDPTFYRCTRDYIEYANRYLKKLYPKLNLWVSSLDFDYLHIVNLDVDDVEHRFIHEYNDY